MLQSIQFSHYFRSCYGPFTRNDRRRNRSERRSPRVYAVLLSP